MLRGNWIKKIPRKDWISIAAVIISVFSLIISSISVTISKNTYKLNEKTYELNKARINTDISESIKIELNTEYIANSYNNYDNEIGIYKENCTLIIANTSNLPIRITNMNINRIETKNETHTHITFNDISGKILDRKNINLPIDIEPHKIVQLNFIMNIYVPQKVHSIIKNHFKGVNNLKLEEISKYLMFENNITILGDKIDRKTNNHGEDTYYIYTNELKYYELQLWTFNGGYFTENFLPSYLDPFLGSGLYAVQSSGSDALGYSSGLDTYFSSTHIVDPNGYSYSIHINDQKRRHLSITLLHDNFYIVTAIALLSVLAILFLIIKQKNKSVAIDKAEETTAHQREQ